MEEKSSRRPGMAKSTPKSLLEGSPNLNAVERMENSSGWPRQVHTKIIARGKSKPECWREDGGEVVKAAQARPSPHQNLCKQEGSPNLYAG